MAIHRSGGGGGGAGGKGGRGNWEGQKWNLSERGSSGAGGGD